MNVWLYSLLYFQIQLTFQRLLLSFDPYLPIPHSWTCHASYILLNIWLSGAPSPVKIGQLLGDVAVQRPYLDSWSNAMYIPNPDKYFTAATKVIAFQYYARRPAYLYLQVFRPSGSMKYKLVASIRHYASKPGVQTVKVTSVILEHIVLWKFRMWTFARRIRADFIVGLPSTLLQFILPPPPHNASNGH